MKKSELFEIVKKTIGEALENNDDGWTLHTRLIDDLNMDFYDVMDLSMDCISQIACRLDFAEDVVRGLAELEDMENDILSPDLKESLKKLAPEIDPSMFIENMNLNDFMRLFTIESMVYLMSKAMKEQKDIEIEDDM